MGIANTHTCVCLPGQQELGVRTTKFISIHRPTGSYSLTGSLYSDRSLEYTCERRHMDNLFLSSWGLISKDPAVDNVCGWVCCSWLHLSARLFALYDVLTPVLPSSVERRPCTDFIVAIVWSDIRNKPSDMTLTLCSTTGMFSTRGNGSGQSSCGCLTRNGWVSRDSCGLTTSFE